ncbi:hypothetical protein J7552_07330 [Wohlfahrtiimonas chitiniclastica]|uniref:hypothetical protein n=1 Tax=Wohlfahrtiimonas chitiniclastica TaxID=400946 RepID=UPI001BCF0EFD|nr:hypothetical protein [Wohlfahrtiimonas chitiniclastica]MBS7821094.1 hypothetical protein [Wohlfahrtiimonas chitiniclastica]
MSEQHLQHNRPLCPKCEEVHIKPGRPLCNACLNNQRKVIKDIGSGLVSIFFGLSIALYYLILPPLANPHPLTTPRLIQYAYLLINPDFNSAPIYILFTCLIASLLLSAYLSKKIFDAWY